MVELKGGNECLAIYKASEKRLTGMVTKPRETLLTMILTVYRTLKANKISVSRRLSRGGGDDPTRVRMRLPIEPQRAWIAESV